MNIKMRTQSIYNGLIARLNLAENDFKRDSVLYDSRLLAGI